MKNKFIEIYESNIKREGADRLLEYLTKTDFFEAPASTRFHLSRPGGLVEHSVHVYERLKKLYMDNPQDAQFPWMTDAEDETIAICGLLHDVCKTNFYTVEMRNRKNETTGAWEKYPFYVVDDKLPYGHGEKSVYIISSFMRLTREEAMAIRWHMGAWEDSANNNTVGRAFELHPLALLTHIADMQATYFDESETGMNPDGK